MAERLVVTLVIGAIAVVVALLLRRRTTTPTTTSYTVPTSLERGDFARPDAPWLVAVFTSASCSSCARTWDAASHLESDAVAVVEAEVERDSALHERYRIDAVPTIVIADESGEVRASFLGPPTATDLWATVAELREPGSTPPGCDHGVGAAD